MSLLVIHDATSSLHKIGGCDADSIHRWSRGLASLVADLEGAGIAASYTRPEEARGGDITLCP